MICYLHLEDHAGGEDIPSGLVCRNLSGLTRKSTQVTGWLYVSLNFGGIGVLGV